MTRVLIQTSAAICFSTAILLALLKTAQANNIALSTLEMLEQKLEVREIKRSHGRFTNIKVKVSGRRDCFFGDLDAIFLDMIYSLQPDSQANQSRLILSLEPITIGDPWMEPQIHELTRRGKEVKEAGFEVTFVVPPTKEPRLLALTLCRDSENSATACLTKEIKPIEEVLKAYSVPSPKEGSVEHVSLPKSVSDKLYFFKALVVDDNSIRFPERSKIDLFAEWLKALSNDSPLSQGLSQVEVGQALNIERIIRSVPLKQKDGPITITLPGFDPTKCNG